MKLNDISKFTGWKKFFKQNIKELNDILEQIDFEDEENKVLPEFNFVFRAFQYHDIKDIKLVILGQDPYPSGDGKNYYAEGLSFSVNPKITKLPASLKNIFTELKNCYPDFSYKNGSLEKWIKDEKILLINSALTVIEGKPNSHAKLWENLTDKIIAELDKNSNCLFLLLGNNAKNKSKFITYNDRIIYGVHPSPLSAHRGFFGSKIFLLVNQKLKESGMEEINWNL
jgi:uracil-DNA glycosylase